jgi:hypothetical protein
MGMIGIMLVFGLLVIGCGNFMDNDENKHHTIAKFDISNATNLFIASASNNARSVGDSPQLFKITDDGYIQDVKYLDDEGNDITYYYRITSVYNVDSNYVIIGSGDNFGYLVRKSDGAVFSLENIGFPEKNGQQYNFTNSKLIQQDGDGNIYFNKIEYNVSSSKRTILKINISNPNQLTKIDYSPDSDYPVSWDLSPQGHIIYRYGNGSNMGTINGTRIRKSNGGLINLPQWVDWWIGFDNNIKYYEYDTSINKSKIVTVHIDSLFQETRTEVEIPAYINMVVFQSCLIKLRDRILAIYTGSNMGDRIYELENPANSPRVINIPEINNIKYVINSDNYYYLSGDNSSSQPILLKINPVDNSVITLLPPNIYDIYAMTVDVNDKITFNALRMSDGVKIIGEISILGEVNILDEESNIEITVLERIK